MGYTIRDYQENDEVHQLHIMKSVLKELYPDYSGHHTLTWLRNWYSWAGWHPTPLKMLLDADNNVVGYGGYGSFFNRLRLGFPYILKEYRTFDRMQQIFDAELQAARKAADNLESSWIYVRSDAGLTKHNQFFSKQAFTEKKQAFLMRIDVSKLNQTFPDRFQRRNFTLNEVKGVSEFSKAVATPTKPAMAETQLVKRLEKKDITPKTHFILKEDDKIKGGIGVQIVEVPEPSETGMSKRAFLNFRLFDFKNPDTGVIKALMFSLYPVLKVNQIERFGFEIREDCLSRPLLEEIGFEYDTKGGAFVYTFEKDL